MANLQRLTGKLFGETATATGDDPEIGQFGSGLAGTYVGTTDVETIQNLPAWSNGFIDSVTPNTQFPPLPEMTGFGKVLSYQENYLLQKGVPEWDSGTTYYTNDFCRVGNTVYRSNIDNNINHNPTAYDGNWMIYSGNDTQVTNCLLEVPQRISYTLVDGALTLKAGSVMIVPYGTTDLSSTYSVGDTFINSGLKVKDTYWDSTNSKFFVWVELQEDLTREVYAGGTDAVRTIVVSFTDTSLTISTYGRALSASSDADITYSDAVFYNTTANLVKRKDSGSIVDRTVAFPIVKAIRNATYDVSAIKQVFNGFGYIGAVMWSDKGIKGLMPNGLNADGTLKNTEFTTDKLMTFSIDPLQGLSGYRILGLSADRLTAVRPYNVFYDVANNTIAFSSNPAVKVGTIVTDSDGNLTNMSSDNALNINSMCDGQWVGANLAIASSVSANASGSALEYSLASYLPNDGYNYEVILVGNVITGTTSGNTGVLRVFSEIITDYQTIAQANTRTTSSMSNGGTLILPVGLDRKVYVSSYSGNTGTFSLNARGYRRIGTNV